MLEHFGAACAAKSILFFDLEQQANVAGSEHEMK